MALLDMVAGRVHAGADVDRLEAVVRERLDVPNALAVNQARIGLYLAVKTALTEERRKVIMSPFTIFDVVNMVVAAGAQPVFADIERASYTIGADQVEALLDDETAAVIVTHTHVLCPDIDRICAMCRQRNITVIEDAAVAFGTHHNGKAVGTLGDVGVYSFGLFKNVSAIFGGMVVTADEDRYLRMKELTSSFQPVSAAQLRSRMIYGLTIDLATNPLVFRALTYWVFRVGFLYDIDAINGRTANDPNPFARTGLDENLRRKPSSLQARLVLSQLDRVERDRQTRTRLAEFYYRELTGIDGITLPSMSIEGSNGYLVFPIQVERREGLLQELMRSGRDCASYYYRNCSDLDIFSHFSRPCPNAQLAATKTVLLPTYPGYGVSEAAKNVSAIRRFYTPPRTGER